MNQGKRLDNSDLNTFGKIEKIERIPETFVSTAHCFLDNSC